MNEPIIQIGNRKIGIDYDPLVIAEIGINHGGSLEVAIEMVDAAFEAGAEIIKHQTHIIDDEMSLSAKKVFPGNSDSSIYDIMKDCSLNEKDELELKCYIEKKGMIFLSTPFSRKAFERLEKFDVLAYKIGSGECNNYPLIEIISKTKKPIILSTGMNNIDSIKKAVNIIRKNGSSFALLHCTNVYPTPHNLVRLDALNDLKNSFPDAVIGLSDHTVDNLACLGSIIYGASIVERHFTDTKNRKGPDIACSMDKNELKDLIKKSKIMKMLKGGKKEPINEEKVTMNFAFATAVATKNIKKGEIISRKNTWVKRPGIGQISAENYEKIIGTEAKRFIKKDDHIKWKDFQ